ncbi:hypothetical protein CASFOL_043043 [Castilleja foliolosa]|uniref:Uncharacterized protein n=1 Tax=Castilleja foliolosa TaxID=1961234 RepID=A0ABD3B876_9LAMI
MTELCRFENISKISTFDDSDVGGPESGRESESGGGVTRFLDNVSVPFIGSYNDLDHSGDFFGNVGRS